MLTLKVIYSGIDGWVWDIHRGAEWVTGGHGRDREECTRDGKKELARLMKSENR